VTGVDFSEAFIEIARREVPQGRFFVQDLRTIDEFPEQFDGVFLQAVLLHFPKAEAPLLLAKLASRLRPDGLLYVAVKASRPGAPEEEVAKESDYGYPYERFFSYYSQQELAGTLGEAGFEVIHSESEPSGQTRWVQLIGRKKA
jgi:SAM-dependent methyltransferase